MQEKAHISRVGTPVQLSKPAQMATERNGIHLAYGLTGLLTPNIHTEHKECCSFPINLLLRWILSFS